MSLKLSHLSLSYADFALLYALQDGADVFSKVDAQHLRSLDKKIPGAIKICKPRNRAAEFGMRCTPKGKALLNDYAEAANKIRAVKA